MIIQLTVFDIQNAKKIQETINTGELVMNKEITLFLLIVTLLSGTGCSPEIGSEAWCKNLAEKPKGDWTANEAAEYTKNCIFR
jgi:hypothetical protein